MAQSQLHKTARNPLGLYELIAENSHGSVTTKAYVLPMKSAEELPKMTQIEEIRPPIGLPPKGNTRVLPGQNSIGTDKL